MLRASARRFLPSKLTTRDRRGIASSIPRLAVPALASSKAKGGGFLGWLLGENPASKVPPLFEPLPGVKTPPVLPDYVAPAPTTITTLKNGLKIACEDTAGPTVTVGLYIDAGSVNETPETFGATHLLERMAFKSTLNRTHFRLVREVEAIGGNILASASREQMAYTGDAIKTHMPEIVEILIDSVRNPVFYEWEVKEQIGKMKAELADIMNNPQSLILEGLHAAGYQGGLATPLVASESALARIDANSLAAFVSENYVAPRMVLAASGVSHEDLCSIAEPLLADMPKTSVPDAPASKYVGGDWRTSADSPKTHVALAFEVPGGWRNEKDSIAVTVLQTLLGGGGSFSAGGPGKGMYSRLYTRVLNKHAAVQSFTAFNSIYNDTGIFGIHATSDPEFVGKLVDLACQEFILVGEDGVTQKELERAKNSTISSVLMNLESRVVVTEDIGRQILTYGHRKSVQEFVDDVKKLTLNDIKGITEKLLNTPLTMASWGDVVHVPRYEEISKRFAV